MIGFLKGTVKPQEGMCVGVILGLTAVVGAGLYSLG